MTTTTITLQQANTSDGSYDPAVARPKPITVTSGTPRDIYLGHPSNPGPVFGQLVGFVDAPGSVDLRYMDALPDNPEDIVGLFLVISEPAGFYADTRVIDSIVSHEEG
jgi:hypothetical protein